MAEHGRAWQSSAQCCILPVDGSFFTYSQRERPFGHQVVVQQGLRLGEGAGEALQHPATLLAVFLLQYALDDDQAGDGLTGLWAYGFVGLCA